MARPRSKYKYVTDNGDEYAVRLVDDIGGETALGFAAAAGTEPRLPIGFTMRHVQLIHAASGDRLVRPVGSLTASAWTAPGSASLTIKGYNDATGRAFTVTGRVGESETIT